MHRLLSKKLHLLFAVIFILCVCAYAISSASCITFTLFSQSNRDGHSSNSLSNTALPRAYFMPDRSEYMLFDNREFTPECLFIMLIFSAILFVSFIYCVPREDRHTKPRVVLLI